MSSRSDATREEGTHPVSIVIREKESGTSLAEAEAGPAILPYEGNLYFDPEAVNHDVLRLTERTYTCSSKGICHWVDYQDSAGRTVRDVAWVYDQPRPGHEAIKGRFGFYAGSRGPTRQDEAGTTSA
jgi:uncharacterized protein (DUF427 family)